MFRRSLRGALLLAALLAAFAPGAGRAQACDPIARAASVQGRVEWRRPPAAEWQALVQEAQLCAGDQIRTDAHSRASISLENRSMLRLREGTEITLEGVRDDGTGALDLLKGAGHFLTRSGPRSLEVETPFTVAGVRGTEFSVSVEATQTLLSVFEGSVAAANPAGSLLLTSGQSAVAAAGQPPLLRVVAAPRDAVRWTLHYLPVVHVRAEDLAGLPWQQSAERALDAQRRGDVPGALAALDASADPGARDPRFLALRASLLLSVGSVEQAEADLERAQALAPADPDALALRSVIAVVQGRLEDADRFSEQAVSAASGSSAARIARSYAQQARFDLAGARESLRRAVEAEPQDALAWARLAELESSFGRLGAARDAAEKATALDPELSRTQTVLGFVHLMRLELADARWAFRRALSLDQADPLPRLGLGLLAIREGDLDAGAREIEIAASLDPADSLVRSYLGKAYFEEKRIGADQREWDMAKQLDPNDPTPWFYSAIARQTTNEPVVALREMQEAIARNDNRAVYRSRLLLDSDAAARSASQGRIFGDLGFQQLALVQGWKSVNQDPNDFSGHRLLAESYASQPRHEIARVSELMQSQLLQPLNTTAIQPRHGEGSLFLLSSQGSANTSFNEFNALFNRNQLNGQLQGLGGQDETWNGAGIVSGIYQRASFSVGYDRFGTDGFRGNNNQDDGVGTAFAQLELGPATSVQAEVRRRDLDTGDLELRFFEQDFSRYLDEDTTTTSARGGLRHSFSPNSMVLLSYVHQQADTDFSDFIPDPLFGDFSIDLDLDETANTGEGQYRYRSDPLDVLGVVRGVRAIVGAGHADVAVDEDTTTEIDFFPFPPLVEMVSRSPDVSHSNGYLYSTLEFAGNVALTLGVSGDAFDEDDGVGSESQINPKVGLTWSPSFLRGTTLRAAAFRTLKRTLVTDQTLEPTQVAGFNQFFDDPNATSAWRYGVALDQVVTKSVFTGFELSKRDLDTPQGVFGAGSFESQQLDWEEYLARAYLFYTPCDWLSLRAEYRYERFERDPFVDAFGTELFFAFERVETHSVPFGVHFFHPSGLGAALGATWMHQDGNFFADTTQTLESGDRGLWFLDAALRFRLPRRYGFLSAGVNNFLDEDSTYQATDVRNPTLRPGRFAYGSVTLAFP
jgi:Flp pilus assembly protein TadD